MMRRLFVLVGCVAAVLLVALPATANNKPTTGTRIGLFAPPATFAADTPFFVEHGFACELGDGVCLGGQISARSSFTLSVDGVLQASTVDVNNAGGVLTKLYLTNFPSGLPAGTHTFVGVWDGGVTQTITAVIVFS